MPDPNSGLLDFQMPSFFWGNDPRVNQQLRQRIALQMMAGNKRPFPKNVGEGLTAIGDSIGEIGMARRLEQGDLAQQDAAARAAAGLTPTAAPSSASSSYAPTRTEDEPAVKAINNAIRTPTAPATPSPDLLSTTPTEGARDVSSADDPWIKRSNAIAGIETGGARNPYVTLGKIIPQTGDRAYGKYQVMGKNVPEWTQEALGRPMSPQEFLANPQAQEAVFKNRFGQYVDKYGDEGAARAWFAGEKGMNRLDASDVHGRLSVKDYGQDFMRRLNQKPRDRVTSAITGDPDAIVRETATAQGGPQQNPTVAAGGPLRATDFSAQSRTPIVAAPRPSPIQPAPIPGYVTPEQQDVPQPRIVSLSPLGQRALAILNANPNNEYVQKGPAGQAYANEVARQKLEQDQVNEAYKKEIETRHALRVKREDQLATAAERQQKYLTGQQSLITPAAPSSTDGGYDRRLGTPQSPQRSGVPVVPPVPAGLTPQQWSEKQAPEMAKAVTAYETAAPQFDEMMKTLRLAREHPGREWGLGSTGKIAQSMPGTAAHAFGQIMEQLQGKNFLTAYNTLKGGGQITEIEGSKAQAAQARLSTAQNKEDFDKALNDFESALRSDLERVQRKVNRPVTAYREPGDNSSVAPDIGQRRKDKSGRIWEYIGGNPELPESRRLVSE